MFESIGKLTQDLKDWNKHVYGNITTRKKDLFKRIANIQRKRDFSRSHHLNQVDLSLRQEFESVIHHEDLLWKQKVRYDWWKLGDRNTKFFHTRTLHRRKNNRITAIRNADGNWIYDPEDIEGEANEFFQSIEKFLLLWAVCLLVDFPSLIQFNLDAFGQFQPFSLCSVLYKLTMKAGFISGQNINGNIILAQELIHTMRSQKIQKWMAIKIDLEKTYGRVMWNGAPLSKFKLVRGIWQGCPLSLYLFVLCMEWLDNLVIFSKADSRHGGVLKTILDDFCALSGHKINARKTNIFFSKGVDEIMVNTISTMFGFQRVHNLGHYLRVPLFHQRVISSTFQFAVEKVRGKL
ncbi:reverse transcriptase [Gossypium australe]|uniref:Reverse transcriptase n=1 Tax=Gossypium australe TaxID=47621 RepID=A0A5B6V0P3_9ROSI|nr:reverse transcriptase [Gossypium australe]